MRPAVDVRERRARARLLERQLLQLELELVQLLLSREAPVDEARQILGQLHLLLEERVAGTSHFREYRSFAYTLRRSFTSDFDDF